MVGGEPIIVPRIKPKLRKDAFPTIFPKPPSYRTASAPKDRQDPAVRVERMLVRHEEKFRKWYEDVISSFCSLKTEVLKRNVNPFITAVNEDYILLFKFRDGKITECPTITVGFKVRYQ